MRLLLLVLILISSLSCRKFVWDNPNDTINSTSEPASLKDGLVAYYPFNGNANDESGSRLNGIVNNALLSNNRFSNSNQAFSFTESSNIILPLDNSRFSNDFTISNWVYLDESSKNFQYPTFIQSENPSFRLQFELNSAGINNKINFYFISNEGTSQQVVDGTVNAPSNNFNKWQHIVIVNKNKVNQLYVDGIRYSVSNEASKIQGLIKDGYIQIGSGGLKSVGTFIGKIDDIRIYNRALTQEEITYLANN